MYRKFYGLEEKPFDLTPDGGLLYLSEKHREGVATLRYGVIADKGFLLLTGGVGTGKTTIINTLLAMVKDKVRVCVLNNPTLNRHEFYHYLAKRLNIRYGRNKGEFILQFSRLLDTCHQNGEKILLIFDEAQVFPVKLLEEVRLLSNQAGERNVLSIFFIGQPELRNRLAHPRLLPLRQRIGITYHLKELTKYDTAQYIAYRLHKAGAVNTSLFTDKAISAIFQASLGNPRLINVICDHALITGFTRDLHVIDKDVIEECLNDIRLPGEKKLSMSEIDEKKEPILPAEKKRNRFSGGSLFFRVALALVLVAGLFYLSYSQGWLQNGMAKILK